MDVLEWLVIKVWYTKDGFSKQYRCENEMWILAVFVFTYIFIIDRRINYPVHGRIKIYDFNGCDN